MLDAYLDYSYYLVYIFYFEILEEKNHDFFENWELMVHTTYIHINLYTDINIGQKHLHTSQFN